MCVLTALCSCRKSGVPFAFSERSGSKAKQNPGGISAVCYCFCYCWEWKDFLVGWGFVTGIFYLLFFLMIIILFMVQWTKELCNLLSNVQFIHIFHLLKLYLLSSIP